MRFFDRLSRSNLTLGLLVSGVMACSGLASSAQAQTIYRHVGPDGQVTFSDRPLPATSAARGSEVRVSGGSAATATQSLPFELRQAAERFPVVLYTGTDCSPCGAGRSLLSSRGIPFTEKTISTREDIDTLVRLAGTMSLPFMTIGRQHVKGYSEQEWAQLLDAAGYPVRSVLPAAYRNPEPTPLVAAQAIGPPVRPSAAAPATEPPSPSVNEPAPANPAGIRF